MYLKNIFIKNMGAIEKFSLVENDLFISGNPKPIILLGKNGTGKTTLLSSIVDALYELSSNCFQDVLPHKGLSRQYFKVSGSRNMRVNTQYSFSYLNFAIEEEILEYCDKNGDLDNVDMSLETNDLISDSLKEGKGKITSSVSQEQENAFKIDFLNNSYCYFPSDRYELPYWINKGVISQLEQFKDIERFSNQLNRDILVRKSLDNIKTWILDVFLDSRADLVFNDDGSASTKMSIGDLNLLRTSIQNIENLISNIVQKNIRLDLNLRGRSQSRIKLIDESSNSEFIPSLDNLSAGQSTLLGIFGTIIQYSDSADLIKSIHLDEIKGIVIIDEIDLHLHIDLQNKVLPELIKLFPKVQFIITTHSPFFLAGLSETFAQEEYLLVNMPNGDIITDSSRFDEFKNAYDLFFDINNNYKYELDMLKSQIRESTKPLIITEGKTDWKHIKSAVRRLAPDLDIEFLEYGEDLKMGDATLKTMAENFKSLPNQRKIICIFDRDNNEILRSYGKAAFNNLGNNVFTMCIPKISNDLDKISIEFYYSKKDLSREDDHGRKLFLGTEFYEKSVNSKCGQYQTRKMDKAGKLVVIDEDVYRLDDKEMKNSIALTKNNFAECILKEHKNFKDMDFSNFRKIIDVIREII
ncbi:AAA family ATPase [Gallibacterium anatis]|uniref:AAA family ATPase n=1 Tax=Gallibacterium anatis TaxID=750 RepID=UPI000BA0596A|nr:AAA family ATPase [Gallibacterium anatis]OZN48276.1 hypothetical protein CF595_11015 [Gallibacterium anatis]